MKSWAHQAVIQEKSIGAAPSGNTLAVLYFRNNSGSSKLDPLQKGISFMLMTDLSKLEDIQLVERARLQAMVEELGLGKSGLVDDKTAPRVGRLLQARYIVGGDVLKGQKADMKIDSGVLLVPGTKMLGNANAEGMLSQILDMEKKILFQIIDILKMKVTPEEKKELRKPLSSDLQALLSFFRAMNSSDNGDYEDAEMYYRRALERDPGLSAAREALEELYRLKLVNPKKRSRALTMDLKDRTSHTSSLFPDASELRYGSYGMKSVNSGQIHVRW